MKVKSRFLEEDMDIKVIDHNKGLTNKDVAWRVKNGQVNRVKRSTTKTIPSIIKTNLFTLFNLINFVLVVMLIAVESYRNVVFVFVAVINLIIGIINEIRAKIIIDKLSLLISNKVKVVRNSNTEDINIKDVVLDDIIILDSGNQVVVDSVVLDGEVEVNEAFVTGEEKATFKHEGDLLLSGSFIISGSCYSQAIRVGEDNFTSKISNDVMFIKKVNSEILRTINKIIKIITFIIVPFGLFTFLKHWFLLDVNWKDTVVLTVGALDGMIPNGLVLLTSTVMAVSVIRLRKYNVLVQELYSLENLARVDVICLDKTGTLTEGKMEVFDIVPYGKVSKEEISNALGNICAFVKDKNATSLALKNKFNKFEEWRGIKKIAFSSKKKFSGAEFDKKGTYLVGAGEYLLKTQYGEVEKMIEEYATNYRVLVIVHTNEEIIDDVVPEKVDILGIALLQDKIRSSAKRTLDYFEKQGVKVNIISGDSVMTIRNIAQRLKINNI